MQHENNSHQLVSGEECRGHCNVNDTFVHYSEMPADAMDFLVHVFEVIQVCLCSGRAGQFTNILTKSYTVPLPHVQVLLPVCCNYCSAHVCSALISSATLERSENHLR